MRSLWLCALALVLCAACRRPSSELPEWRASEHSRESGEQNPGARTAEAPDTDPAVAALALYRATCAGCHGATGHGDGPNATPMARPADFTTAAFQSSHTDEQLRAVLVAGRGAMPAFGQTLRPEAIGLLIQQVRRFAAAP